MNKPFSCFIHDGPYSHLNVPGPAERAAREAQLDAAGARRFPPPFGHAVAVLSDIDGSDRERSYLYHDQLIRQLGLDFGDSVWLFGRHIALPETPATGRLKEMPGLGMTHPSGDPEGWTVGELSRICSFREMVAGMLRGNFDHFHAFMPSGHRLVWLGRTSVEGADAVFTVPTLQEHGYFRTTEMRIAGLGVVGEPGAVAGVQDARATERHAGRRCYGYERAGPEREGSIRLGDDGEAAAVLLPPPVGPERPLAHLWLVSELRVRCASPEAAAGLRAIAVFNATPELILPTLAGLDETWNVRTSLITEHSGYCFLNEMSHEVHSSKVLAESSRRSDDARGWVIGLPDGPMRFSAIPDDPGSFCRLFPWLVADRGFRFVNAGGLTGSPDFSFDAGDVVAPSLVRDGSGVYICRRMMPTLPEGVDREDPVLKPTRAPSFGHRLRRLYGLMADRPGRVWPFYTHLGAIQPLERVSEPYLESGPLLELQDRAFGITGRFAPDERVWFTRGTGMCEHALLMQRIAEHTDRSDANAIRIRPWFDETLGCELPVSANQTYGLTFAVDDLSRASVTLGDRPIEELARFDHADGRWVTLMPSVIRAVLFDAVDPLSRPEADVQVAHAQARFAPAAGGGELRLDASPGTVGTISFAPVWIDPAGAQAFIYRARSADLAAAVAWLIETADGGRFAWGDGELVRSQPGLTAWRTEPVPMNAAVVVPLWNLTWKPGAAPGGPIPTREICRVTLIARGGVAVSSAAFVRPSAAQRDAPVRGRVVVGSAPSEFAASWSILCRDGDAPVATCRPDPRGWFAFDGINADSCIIEAEDRDGQRFTPVGGTQVETRWDAVGVHFGSPV